MPLFSNFPLTVLVWDAKCHAMSRGWFAGWFANAPLVAFFTQPEDPVMSSVYPRSFSHIGLSVTDLDAAVNFYTDVMGWYLIMPTTTISEDNSAIGVMCTDVFGAGWGSFRIAHLSTGDRIGVEIFEFRNAEKPHSNFEYWKTGIFHFSVQDPDVEGLAAKVVAAGGKQRMPIREYFPGEKPFRMVYMEDPFGNILEIYSHSYELTYSAGAYQ
jgi:lactoylglutathione lyase family protein